MLNSDRWNAIDKQFGVVSSKKNRAEKYTWAWKDDNVHLAEGQLRLNFRREQVDSGGVAHFSAGNVNSDCKFAQKYGFFEARIQFAHADGRNSAFWMMPNGGLLNNGQGPSGSAANGAEIDIAIGSSTAEKYLTNLKWDGYGKHGKQ